MEATDHHIAARTVTRLTSSTVVSPWRIFATPSSRKSRMPRDKATSRISDAFERF